MKRSLTFINDVSFIKPNQYCSGRDYISATLSILLLALLHAVIVYAVVEMNLDTHKIRIDKYVYQAYLIYSATLVGFLFFYPIFVMVIVRPRRLVSYVIHGCRWHLFSKERLLFSYPVLAIIPLDKSIYSSFKTEISNLNSFWLDAPLYKLDRVIFLGNDPWRTFQQIIGDPNITCVIDFLYHPIWMSLVTITILFHALGRHSLEIRLRFFLSYIIVWAGLGSALATVLSSAGPCYFSQVTGQTSPYAELFGYLYSVKADGFALNAVRIQEMLWNGHVNSILEYGGGISAMPSIHIATTALFALSMRNTYPILEKLLYCFTFVIWVGSIHLGWHYASDGLVSGLCVIVIWHYSGKLTNKIITKKNMK
ncbi:MAG: phosphatase PAP2 family protein [Chlorobiales bacterium]|nr:phosphatase PAP2 family protein [Chlorobiales bacterium]